MEIDAEFEFQVQRAPSARGTCHGCGAKIGKDDVRVGLKRSPGEESDDDESPENSEIIRWLHCKYNCFTEFRDAGQWLGCPAADTFIGVDDLDEKGRKILTSLVSDLHREVPPTKAAHHSSKAHRGANRTPSSSRSKRRAAKKDSSSEGSNSEDEDDSPRNPESDEDVGTPSSAEDESEESDHAKGKRTRRTPKRKPKAKAKSRRLADPDDSYDSEDEAPAKKSKATPRSRKTAAASPAGKYKCVGLRPEKLNEITEEMNKQAKKTVAQLKDDLRRQGQLMTGRKQDLVERVSEAKVMGCIPACPKCEEGRLSFCRSTGSYTCAGHFDSNAGHLVKCNFSSNDVERLPWKD